MNSKYSSLNQWLVRWFLILCVLSASASALANEHDLNISTPRLEITPDGNWSFNSDGNLRGSELGRLIESTIGKDKYQTTTVILNTCHSGAGISAVKGGLKGSSQVIASCGKDQTTRIRLEKDGKTLTGFLPGFFESIIADPDKPVDSHIETGKENEPRLPKTPAEEAAKRKYERYRSFLEKKNEQRKKDKKEPFKLPPPWDKGGRNTRIQEPEKTETDDKPGAKKIASGESSNHAIIYRTDGRSMTEKESKKAIEALKNAGYDTVDELSPLAASDFADIKAAEGGKAPTLRDDAATPANLKKKLESLKSVMSDKETLTIVVMAHGSITTVSNATQSSIGIGNGRRFSLAQSGDSIGDHQTGSLLAEEAVSGSGDLLIDDYSFERWALPVLAIQTVEEFSDSGDPVSVYINNLFLGNIDLVTQNTGNPFGYHTLTFSDQFIVELINTTGFINGLDLRFEFSGLNDFFTLATDEDLANISNGAGFGRSGINLVFNLDGDDADVVPEPATWLMILAGLFGLRGHLARDC